MISNNNKKLSSTENIDERKIIRNRLLAVKDIKASKPLTTTSLFRSFTFSNRFAAILTRGTRSRAKRKRKSSRTGNYRPQESKRRGEKSRNTTSGRTR